MRALLATLATAGLLTLAGCTGTPGGPGVPSTAGTGSSPKFQIGPEENTFRISAGPIFGEGIKQGEQKVDSISISRGKNFDQDVTLKFENVPSGVSVSPASPVIKKSENKVEITLKATDEAALGTHTIKVLGHPSTGADATADLKVTVHKK